MKREEADRLAREEYSIFEERRRLDAERVGELEAMKQLEQAGRTAEKAKRSGSARKGLGGQ